MERTDRAPRVELPKKEATATSLIAEKRSSEDQFGTLTILDNFPLASGQIAKIHAKVGLDCAIATHVFFQGAAVVSGPCVQRHRHARQLSGKW